MNNVVQLIFTDIEEDSEIQVTNHIIPETQLGDESQTQLIPLTQQYLENGQVNKQYLEDGQVDVLSQNLSGMYLKDKNLTCNFYSE